MVDITTENEKLIVAVQGIDRLWAFKRKLEIPLTHVTAVHADPKAAGKWWHGIKFFGTRLPGVLKAGTFYEQKSLLFWDIHDPANGIVIELTDERYRQLIVEVADPSLVIEQIEAAWRRFDPVQEAGEESFPASDPPAY